MWTPTVFLAAGSLIVALGAFLLSALSKLESSNNKRAALQIQSERRKQEGIGILRQAQSLEQSKLLSLRLTRGDATQNKVTSQRLPRIEKLISDTQQNIAERDQIIEQLEAINPKGEISSSYSVALESLLGTAEQMRSKSELDLSIVEQLATEVQNIVSRTKDRGDKKP